MVACYVERSYLDNVVRILVSKNLASCDRDIVLLAGKERAVICAGLRQSREVVYRSEDIQLRTVRLAQEHDLTG